MGDQSHPYCTFYSDTEALGDHSYGDADWNQDYNTHGGGLYYLWWDSTKSKRDLGYNSCSTLHGGDYVPSVCNSASY